MTFGEQILYKVPKKVRMGKSEPRWRGGVWIGSVESSDEHLIGTALGIIARHNLVTFYARCRGENSYPHTII